MMLSKYVVSCDESKTREELGCPYDYEYVMTCWAPDSWYAKMQLKAELTKRGKEGLFYSASLCRAPSVGIVYGLPEDLMKEESPSLLLRRYFLGG